MLFILFLKGILIGYLGSVPIGPINVLIIQRTVTSGRNSGFYSGIGAALSDSSYVSIASFSLSIIIGFISGHELLFKVCGAVILTVLGCYIFFSNPHIQAAGINQQKKSTFSLIMSTYLLTLSNPFTLFAYLGLFASIGILKNISAAWHPVFLIAGFFIGACGWWFTLTGIINRLHGRFNFKNFRIFNRITGTVIFLFVASTLIFYILSHLQQ